jgi:hypothetical protein
LRVAEHDLGRDDSFRQDPPLAVDVADEGVDRADALLQPV